MQARVKDIITIMEKHFPVSLAESWDNVGLQLGEREQGVERLMVALDLDNEILEQALANKVDMIVTHHPLIFKALKNIDYDVPGNRLIRNLIQANISVYSAHTNLDSAPNGLNQFLAEKLGLAEIEPLFPAISEELYKIVVYVPVTHVEVVRQAMTEAGAGNIGRYSDCSFCVRGTGTFRPGENTNPYLGQKGQLEMVDEYRLETVAYEGQLPAIIKAMQASHPYEEVAYDLYQLGNQGRAYCPGRKGLLPEKMDLGSFAGQVKTALALEDLRVVGDLTRDIQRVAVVSGAGASFHDVCIKQGIDVLVTGDLKYHEAKDAEAAGLTVIDAGHQGTEQIVVPLLIKLLEDECRQNGIKTIVLPSTAKPCFKIL